MPSHYLSSFWLVIDKNHNEYISHFIGNRMIIHPFSCKKINVKISLTNIGHLSRPQCVILQVVWYSACKFPAAKIVVKKYRMNHVYHGSSVLIANVWCASIRRPIWVTREIIHHWKIVCLLQTENIYDRLRTVIWNVSSSLYLLTNLFNTSWYMTKCMNIQL